MDIVFLLALSSAYLFIRNRLWFPIADPHVGSMAYPYRIYGNDFLKYFNSLGSHLSVYVTSTTFGRGKRLGQVAYDLMLTCSGICLYTVVRILFASPSAALIATALFYFCSLLPGLFDLYVEPEAHAAFFTLLGFTVVTAGIQYDLLFCVVFGSALSLLGFLCKSSAIDCIFVPVYVFLASGASLAFFASLLSMVILLAGVEILYMLFGRKTFINIRSDGSGGNSFRLYRLFRFVLWDTARHYPDKSLKGILRTFFLPIGHHLSIIFPIVFLFLIGILYSDLGSAYQRLLLIWMLIGALPALLRMQSYPLYYFTSHIPLCIGASFGAIHLFRTLHPEWYPSVIAVSVVLVYVAAKNYRKRSCRSSIRPLFDNIREVVDFLQPNLANGSPVFQDSKFPQIYYELECSGPDREFLMFHIQKLLMQHDKEKLQRLIRFFVEKKPAYYISFRKDYQEPYGHNLSLSHVEEISGLRYQLVFYTEFIHVYELVNATAPERTGPVDIDRLFDGNYIRHADDRFHHVRFSVAPRLPAHIGSIVDYLKDKVTADDYIFQNSYNVDIYHALPAQPPPRVFFRADRLHRLSTEEIRRFIDFFKEKRPKYYIGMQPSVINLTALEKAAGIRYEIDHVSSYSIYRLIESGLPAEPIDLPGNLLQFDNKRSRQDIAYLNGRIRSKNNFQRKVSDAYICNYSR